jgi:hypothetical protein
MGENCREGIKVEAMLVGGGSRQFMLEAFATGENRRLFVMTILDA